MPEVNAAIQLLPFGNKTNVLPLIDAAIATIQQSGLKFVVCPFETVVEGDAQQVYELIEKIRTQTLQAGCNELIINIKLHAANKAIFISDKLKNYS